VAAGSFASLHMASVVLGTPRSSRPNWVHFKIEMLGEVKHKEPEQPSTTTTFHPVRRPRHSSGTQEPYPLNEEYQTRAKA